MNSKNIEQQGNDAPAKSTPIFHDFFGDEYFRRFFNPGEVASSFVALDAKVDECFEVMALSDADKGLKENGHV